MWPDTKFFVAAMLLAALLISSRPAFAEYPELEKLLEDPAKALAEQLADQKVVVSARELSRAGGNWAVHQAAGVELTMALRKLKIDAIRAAADSRLDKLDTLKSPYAAKDVKPLKDVDRSVLVGVEWTSTPKLKLKLVAFTTNPEKALWSEIVSVSSSEAAMEKNIPTMNTAVVEFAKEKLGEAVNGGGQYELPDAGLKAAGASRRGFVRWGRELGPREPWLPGDILMLEAVNLDVPGMKRNFIHHAAIVEKIKPDEVTVLHQNTYPKGRTVQRETWQLKGLDDGEIVAFRAWTWPAEPPIPTEHPQRFVPAKPVMVSRSSTIDLIKTLDTRLDRVHGTWCIDNKILKSQGEQNSRIQIPVVPPKSYVLKMSVKRNAGAGVLGLGIVVDGHQTMVAIDDVGNSATGLSNLDGKPAAENETYQIGELLPVGKKIDIECRVEPGQVLLTVAGKKTFEWKGDATLLTVGTEHMVLNKEWLFLATNNSEFDITSFTLEPIGTK